MAAFAVLYEGNRFTLDDAQVVLQDHGVPTRREEDRIIVRVDDGLEMKIGLFTGPDVLEESADMAEYNDDVQLSKEQRTRLARCDCRFEVFVDSGDLPAIVDETTVLTGVQFALVRLTNGFVWRGWNGEMNAPEDFSDG